jgi:DNA (cytosine-5)-methyltransferase 1
MVHLGDICKINGAEIEPVWAVTGGSPCQDLSIAGKRAGLAGARSGLFMEQVRIVKEMREEDKRNGRTGDMVRPRFLVWENVVGAFSSNRGKDFAAVLEEIARIAEPGFSLFGLPEKWKWTKAGSIDGDGWSIAWRTHDAKDWGKTIRDSRTGNVIRLGTPQRRRRISVVADFGGESAAQIQFECESVSGHLAESGTAGEGFAEATESGFNPAVRDCMTAWDCQSKRIFNINGKSHTLQGGVGGGVNNPAIFVAIPINDKATRWQGGGESRNHDGSGNGLGIGKEGDPSPTLTAGDRHGVVALDMTHACDVIRERGEQAPTLQARMGTGGNQVPLTYGIGNGQANEASIMAEEVSQTLNTMHDAQAVMCSSVDFRNFREGGEVNGTLQAKESGGQSLNLNNTVRQNMVVRRLTPMECERLQGFPDHWTDIGEWTDEKGKKHKDADSPRYKALGNSVAMPFWDWMLRRMARYLPEGATLGSLFDGIAGFPLIWERIHGKGTARWASEIEPFPIAVTKKHFPEEE